jgi:hypothetical protein
MIYSPTNWENPGSAERLLGSIKLPKPSFTPQQTNPQIFPIHPFKNADKLSALP